MGKQKRYCVVMHESETDHSNHVLEFYWADSYDHAEEQAKDANPPDAEIVAVVRDPVQPRLYAFDTELEVS